MDGRQRRRLRDQGKSSAVSEHPMYAPPRPRRRRARHRHRSSPSGPYRRSRPSGPRPWRRGCGCRATVHREMSRGSETKIKTPRSTAPGTSISPPSIGRYAREMKTHQLINSESTVGTTRRRIPTPLDWHRSLPRGGFPGPLELGAHARVPRHLLVRQRRGQVLQRLLEIRRRHRNLGRVAERV
jgi:hypothetical protein